MECSQMVSSLAWPFTREVLAERKTVMGLGDQQGRTFPNATLIK